MKQLQGNPVRQEQQCIKCCKHKYTPSFWNSRFTKSLLALFQFMNGLGTSLLPSKNVVLVIDEPDSNKDYWHIGEFCKCLFPEFWVGPGDEANNHTWPSCGTVMIFMSISVLRCNLAGFFCYEYYYTVIMTSSTGTVPNGIFLWLYPSRNPAAHDAGITCLIVAKDADSSTWYVYTHQIMQLCFHDIADGLQMLVKCFRGGGSSQKVERPN